MSSLAEIAQPFIDVAHRIVWATVATIDAHDRPRSRVLHPIWEWDGDEFVGWITTRPTPVKVAHLAQARSSTGTVESRAASRRRP